MRNDIQIGMKVKIVGAWRRGQTGIVCGPLMEDNYPICSDWGLYKVRDEHIQKWKIDESFLGKDFVRLPQNDLCINV